MSSAPTPSPPDAPVVDERLDSIETFGRCVARVTPCMPRWFRRWRVAPGIRQDVLQDTLLRMLEKSDSYNPARGRWEAWAYGFFGLVVREYRRKASTRTRHVDVMPPEFLPEVAADGKSPEEETAHAMKRRMLDRCLKDLDPDSAAILLAKDFDEIPMEEIATAHGVSLPTAYAYYRDARARLQVALDREQGGKRALGVAVLPLTLAQLIASDASPTEDISADMMRPIWKRLDRAMAAAVAEGRLRDDGSKFERYMGSPSNATTPRLASRVARTLLGPRGLPALTAAVGAAGGALVTYAIMRGAAHDGTTADVRALAQSTAAHVGHAAAPNEPVSPDAVEEPEPRDDAGAAERTVAGAGASPAQHDDPGEEKVLFEQGKTAYRGSLYPEAIGVFTRQTRKFPRGPYAGMGEKLLILSLIGEGRKPEARQRIEQLRRANPENPTLKELEAALTTAN